MNQGPQGRLRAEATRLLKAGVAGQVFPGGSVCVSFREGGKAVFVTVAGGRLAANGPVVDPSTPYDLASLTKPFVAMAGLRCVVEGLIGLDVRADAVLSDVRGGIGGSATFEQLLTHRSGLAPWGGLYLDVPHEPGTSAARRWILSEASRRAGDKPPGSDVYSDLGYIIAGEMLARPSASHSTASSHNGSPSPCPSPTRSSLQAPSRWTVARNSRARRPRPNGVNGGAGWCEARCTTRTAPPSGASRGTRACSGRLTAWRCSGARCSTCSPPESDFLPPEVLTAALAEREGGTHRLGWDGKSAGPSAAGRRLSPRSFGHLGFTGTSIWCDPDRDLVITLLTNRVHPSRANEKIKGFRPAFHDSIVAAFER